MFSCVKTNNSLSTDYLDIIIIKANSYDFKSNSSISNVSCLLPMFFVVNTCINYYYIDKWIEANWKVINNYRIFYFGFRFLFRFFFATAAQML